MLGSEVVQMMGRDGGYGRLLLGVRSISDIVGIRSPGRSADSGMT